MSLLDEFMPEPESRVAAALEKDAYDKLPESIKMYVTRKEWMWLSDAEKHALVTEECEPVANPD